MSSKGLLGASSPFVAKPVVKLSLWATGHDNPIPPLSKLPSGSLSLLSRNTCLYVIMLTWPYMGKIDPLYEAGRIIRCVLWRFWQD